MKYRQIFREMRIRSQDKDCLTLSPSFRQTRILLQSDFFHPPSTTLKRLFHAVSGKRNGIRIHARFSPWLKSFQCSEGYKELSIMGYRHMPIFVSDQLSAAWIETFHGADSCFCKDSNKKHKLVPETLVHKTVHALFPRERHQNHQEPSHETGDSYGQGSNHPADQRQTVSSDGRIAGQCSDSECGGI